MDKKLTDVPYIVYESVQAKNERILKRLIISLVITVGLLFVSNMAWLYAWTGYDYSSSENIEYTQDSSGTNIIGDGNEVSDGSKVSHCTDKNQAQKSK